jgi:hypothetical protein
MYRNSVRVIVPVSLLEKNNKLWYNESMSVYKPHNSAQLPPSFRPLLWSYDFAALDPEKDRKTIIINTINYGDLPHWRWLIQYYGKDEIRAILSAIPGAELRPHAQRLAGIVFSLTQLHHVPRGAH